MKSSEICNAALENRYSLVRVTAIAATAVVLLYQAFAVFSRVVVNDDYLTLYTAWLRAEGKVPGRDFFLASYYSLPDVIALFFRLNVGTWFPLYAGRLLLVGVMVIVAILLYKLGVRLFSPMTGWLAPLFALSSAAMIYRGLDLRADLITAAIWLGIFVLLTSTSLSNRQAVCVGMLLGLAIVNRFKAAWIAPFLLIEYLARRRERSPWGAAAFTSLGAITVFVAYAAWIASTDGLGTFFEINRRLLGGMADYQVLGAGARGRTLHASLSLDPVYWALAGVGMVLRVRLRAAYDSNQNRLCGSLVALAVSTIILNPAYYEYNLVTLQPLLAPFPAYALARLINLVSRRPVPGFLLTLLPVFTQLPAFLLSLDPSNRHQKELQTFFLRHTPPAATVFAMEGVGLYRRSIFHWQIPRVFVDRYRRGEWRFADELRRTPAEVIVLSYRVPDWMVWTDRQFVLEHYQRLAPLILVPGFTTDGGDGRYRAELLVSGEYEGTKGGNGRCALNEEPFKSGTRWSLLAGTHHVTASGARCGLRRYYSPQARALLTNSGGLPYLVYPYLGAMPKALPVTSDASPLR